jgi:hypothetical protein
MVSPSGDVTVKPVAVVPVGNNVTWQRPMVFSSIAFLQGVVVLTASW